MKRALSPDAAQESTSFSEGGLASNQGGLTGSAWYVPSLWLLAVVIVVLDAFPVLRLHLDEAGYIGRLESGNWSAFGNYRFYRVLGVPLNYALYWVTGASPLLLSLVQASAFILGTYVFSRTLVTGLVEHGAVLVAGLVWTVVLFLPFSMEVLLTRLFPQLAVYGVSVLLVRMAWRYDGSRGRTAAMLALYALSLFVYEIAMLLPVYLLYVVSTERQVTRQRIAALAAGFMGILALFILTQLMFSAAQPKLIVVASLMDTQGAAIPLQVVRKVLLPLYYYRWAAGYLALGTPWPIWWAALTGVAIALLIYCTWHGVRIVGYGRVQFRSGRMALHGLVLGLCSVTPFGLYFVATRHLVTPPLYCLLLWNTGMALVAVSGIRWLRNVSGPVLGRACVTGGLAVVLCSGLLLFLAGRAGALQTVAEVEGAATILERIPDPRGIGQVVVSGLEPVGMFARGRCGFPTQLRVALQRSQRGWGAIETRTEGAGTAKPTEGDIVLLDVRSQVVLRTERGGWAGAGSIDSDPFALHVLGYQLAFSEAAQCIKLQPLR